MESSIKDRKEYITYKFIIPSFHISLNYTFIKELMNYVNCINEIIKSNKNGEKHRKNISSYISLSFPNKAIKLELTRVKTALLEYQAT